MKIQIKTIFGKLLYESDAENIKTAVEKAVAERIPLSGADLSGADLEGADLRGAYLGGANDEKIIIEKTPLQILTDVYDIIVFDKHMKIGCEFHPLADWWKFDTKRIAKMDGTKATHFWKTWKKPLQAICTANGRGL